MDRNVTSVAAWLIVLCACGQLFTASTSDAQLLLNGSDRRRPELMMFDGPFITADNGSKTPTNIYGMVSRNQSNNSVICTPRSVESFPPDLFTLEQKQRGALLIHVLVLMWLLAALIIVCENYFVASLEVICESLHLKPDVAGATFMAAGNSTLGLLASVIGVFLAKSDVGVSTVVGSAIFNNLMIPSLCGLTATHVVCLSFWPLFRDCGFYSLSVIAFVGIIQDEVVTWYESAVLLALFMAYIVVMLFNNRVDDAIFNRWPSLSTGGAKRLLDEEGSSESKDGNTPDDPRITNNNSRVPSPLHGILLVELETRMSDVSTVGDDEDSMTRGTGSLFSEVLMRAYWIFMLPWVTAFYYTIPDCKRPGVWRRLFLLTFLSSVVWISGMIYVLVWMVCIIGDTIGIPDTVMGLTLLAVGTCLPDAIAGVFVSRKGVSEMAIASSISSIVMDITVCLGLPWFISTALLRPGSTIVIHSSGLTYTSITLLSTVSFLLAAVCLNRMRIDRKLSIVLLVLYLVVVTFACLYESNVFGPLNPVPCPRE